MIFSKFIFLCKLHVHEVSLKSELDTSRGSLVSLMRLRRLAKRCQLSEAEIGRESMDRPKFRREAVGGRASPSR